MAGNLDYIADLSARLTASTRGWLNPRFRTVLEGFGYRQRRREYVVELKAALAEAGISADFDEYTHLDDRITLRFGAAGDVPTEPRPIPGEMASARQGDEGSDEWGSGTLTARFGRAVAYACRLDVGEIRQGARVPHVSHLLGVAALVLEADGNEDQAIAAVLHHQAEERGPGALDEIRDDFGTEVALIVEGCSDAWVEPKAPWGVRKMLHINRLYEQPPEVLRVSAADALHTARSIVADYRPDGDAVFDASAGDRDGTLWHLRMVLDAYRRLDFASFLVDELEATLDELWRLAAVPRWGLPGWNPWERRFEVGAETQWGPRLTPFDSDEIWDSAPIKRAGR